MSYTHYSVCLAELMRGMGITTPTHCYKPEQAFADGKKIADKIAKLQAEVEALRKDSARLDWIIDNASSAGGGNGFTLKVFIPVDCECVRTAIDTQALQEPK